MLSAPSPATSTFCAGFRAGAILISEQHERLAHGCACDGAMFGAPQLLEVTPSARFEGARLEQTHAYF